MISLTPAVTDTCFIIISSSVALALRLKCAKKMEQLLSYFWASKNHSVKKWENCNHL